MSASRLLALAAPNRSVAAGPPWRRRTAWWVLLAGVLLGHGLLSLWLQENLVGWGDGGAPMPQRMAVAFVRALAPAAPPPPGAAVAARPKLRKAGGPALPASAPAPQPERKPEPEPEPQPELPPVNEAREAPRSAPEPAPASEPVVAAVADLAAPVAAAPPAAAPPPALVAFEWPPSTSLSYVLTGNYRGEVHGNARVQWIRQDSRYQVHLDVTIGPSFAPLISRRMTSDGELGEKGLSPRRYDEATRLPFQQARRQTLQFTPQQVTMPNGSQQDAPPGLQDSASQFVQLTWLFTTQPDLLRAGNTVTMPLALPRRIGSWVYDILGQERLVTPVGELDTFHLKPRLGERRPGNELSAEVWFAPTLQYLPVRIRIQQDADTYLDLLLDAAPMQAAPAASGAAPR